MIINFSKRNRICQTLSEILRRAFYPPRCAGCDEVLGPAERERCFCGRCQKKVIPVREPFCKRCGRPLTSDTEDLCSGCRGRDFSFDMGRSSFVYRGPVRLAMYRLKYAGRKGLARPFARRLCADHGRWLRLRGVQAVSYVPMFAGKRRVRGYDQARELAKALAGELSLPFVEEMVVRIKNTRPQKELGPYKRRKNLKRSFKIGKDGVKYSVIVVVDDIMTTGASIDTVSAVLKEAGAKEVYFLTVATGLPL